MPENLGTKTGNHMTVLRDVIPTVSASLISTDPYNRIVVGTDGGLLVPDSVVPGVRACSAFDWAGLCSTPNIFPTGAALTVQNWGYLETLEWDGTALLQKVPAGTFFNLDRLGGVGAYAYVGVGGPHPDPWAAGNPNEDYCVGVDTSFTAAGCLLYDPTNTLLGTGVLLTTAIISWYDPATAYLWLQDGSSMVPYTGCRPIPKEYVESVAGKPKADTLASGVWLYLGLSLVIPSDPLFDMTGLGAFVTTAEASSLYDLKWSRSNMNYTPPASMMSDDLFADEYIPAVLRAAETVARYKPMLDLGPEGYAYLYREVPLFRDAANPGSDMRLLEEWGRTILDGGNVVVVGEG